VIVAAPRKTVLLGMISKVPNRVLPAIAAHASS
jgi:hypothetical protein